MNIRVERILHDDRTTISKVYIDGVLECFGLEDVPRDIKVAGKTRVPAGIYPVVARTVGRIHAKYVKRFGAEHKGTLWVRKVPGFKWVLIHIGNTEKDTAGCLLIGEWVAIEKCGMRLIQSRGAYRALYKKVIDAALYNRLMIEFIDRDTH